MRRACVVAVVCGCVLAAAAPALALPHLSTSRTREISTLVNRFVNDLVLRRDLADGWKISGPDLRGDLTRKAWLSGRALPVQQLDVLNDPRTAWYAKWKTRSEIGLVVSLRTGRGKKAVMYQEETMLVKRHGRWVVDLFYVDGIFRLGAGHSGSCVSAKCKVTGLYDYRAASGGGGGAMGKPRIGRGGAIGLLLGVAGLPVVALLAFGLVAYARKRRAHAAYLASRVNR